MFDAFAAPKGADDHQLWLADGEPMLFGSEKTGGIKDWSGRYCIGKMIERLGGFTAARVGYVW